MGYATEYELNVQNARGIENEIEESLNEISGYAIELGEVTTMKWYDHQKDMTQISKNFPDVVFTLDGVGEESGDIWKAMYKNGKSKRVRAEIVIPNISVDDLT